jgi:HEAT repeat protein
MLVVALGDGSSRVRRAAARAIGRIDGPLATRALLERSSADLSPAVRAEAASALGRILRERASTSGDAAPST